MDSCTSTQSILARFSFMNNLSCTCCTDPVMHTNSTRYQGTSICHVLESAILVLPLPGAIEDVNMHVSSFPRSDGMIVHRGLTRSRLLVGAAFYLTKGLCISVTSCVEGGKV